MCRIARKEATLSGVLLGTAGELGAWVRVILVILGRRASGASGPGLAGLGVLRVGESGGESIAVAVVLEGVDGILERESMSHNESQ